MHIFSYGNDKNILINVLKREIPEDEIVLELRTTPDSGWNRKQKHKGTAMISREIRNTLFFRQTLTSDKL